MSEMLEFEKELQPVFDELSNEMGQSLFGSGDIFEHLVEVEFSEAEGDFSPTPVIRKNENGTPIMVCSMEGYEEWKEVFGVTSVLSEAQIRDAYIATGLSWLEICFSVRAAEIEKEILHQDDPSATAKKRVEMIHSGFLSNDDLAKEVGSCAQVEINGLDEIVKNLSQKDNQEINKYRHGIGMAIWMLDLTSEEKLKLKSEFFESLQIEMDTRESHLKYLLGNVPLVQDTGLTIQEVIKRGFPTLSFASAFPVNLSYVNEVK